MPPPRRAASRRPRCRRRSIAALETTLDTAAAKAPESRPPHVPAPEPRRVRARDSRAARPRRRRRRLAAARHEERELRQHRRRADAVADAARGVPERRRRHQPPGGRRSHRAGHRHDLHQPELHVAASVGSRRGRAVRHARRHGRRARLPGRRRVRVRDDRSTPATNARFEDIDISVNGERVALLDVRDRRRRRRRRPRRRRRSAPSRSSSSAGQHQVSAAFVRRFEGPYEDLDSAARLVVRRRRVGRRRHHDAAAPARPRSSAGPSKATGVSETPAARRSSRAGRPRGRESGRARGRSSPAWRRRRTAGR